MPYALLIGILIAFTALVPIFEPLLLCRGKFSDLYGKSKTGSFIYYSFSAFAADRRKPDLSSCGWRISRTSINLGTGGSYNRRKSYGNYRYADFHSTCIGILYYIPGVRISAPKKTTYKTSNENGCGRVCGGGNCVILILPNENNDMIQI